GTPAVRDNTCALSETLWPKVEGLGLEETVVVVAAATPVPDNATVVNPFPVLSSNTRSALPGPTDVGENIAPTVQLDPTCSVVKPQVLLVMMKSASPEILAEDVTSAALPVFVNVTFCVALEE